MGTFKFSGQGVAFLSHFWGKEDIRFYLNNSIKLVPLTPEQGGGVVGISSNGHRCGFWHDEQGHAEKEALIYVSNETAKQCTKKPKIGNLVIIDGSENITVMDEGGAYAEQRYVQVEAFSMQSKYIIDAKFPNISPLALQVLGAKFGLEIGGNPLWTENLTPVIKAFRKLGRMDNKNIDLHFGREDKEENAATVIVSPALPQAACLVMPMNTTQQPIAPGFLAALSPADGGDK